MNLSDCFVSRAFLNGSGSGLSNFGSFHRVNCTVNILSNSNKNMSSATHIYKTQHYVVSQFGSLFDINLYKYAIKCRRKRLRVNFKMYTNSTYIYRTYMYKQYVYIENPERMCTEPRKQKRFAVSKHLMSTYLEWALELNLFFWCKTSGRKHAH